MNFSLYSASLSLCRADNILALFGYTKLLCTSKTKLHPVQVLGDTQGLKNGNEWGVSYEWKRR